MTTWLVAFVVFSGVAGTVVTALLAVRLRAEAARLAISRRIDLGRSQVQDEGPSSFLGQDLRVLARPPTLAEANPLGVTEVAGALAGLLLGLATFGWPVGLAGLAVGLLPMIYGWRRRANADARMVRQLPGCLEVLSSAMRAGHAFSEALRLAANETEAPLQAELVRVVDEHDFGIELRDTLTAFSERHPRCLELRLFVSSVLFQMQAGGNLIELLEQLSASIRDRVVFEDKARAITAEVRSSTKVLTALPFVAAVVVAILVPHHFDRMLASSFGTGLLVASGFATLFGYVVVHELARSLEP